MQKIRNMRKRSAKATNAGQKMQECNTGRQKKLCNTEEKNQTANA